VVSILAGSVAFERSPWLLLHTWNVPNKARRHWIVNVRHNIREGATIFAADGSTVLPEIGEIPAAALDGGTGARFNLQRILLLTQSAFPIAPEVLLQQGRGRASLVLWNTSILRVASEHENGTGEFVDFERHLDRLSRDLPKPTSIKRI
jgi:hypothetical protein